LKFGDWVKKEAFIGITWLKLFACALLLLVVIALERIFRAWLVKMQRRKQLRDGQTIWSVASLGAILGPVSLLILVYGTYGALSPLFSHFI
jgi:MscS family membrane protein